MIKRGVGDRHLHRCEEIGLSLQSCQLALLKDLDLAILALKPGTGSYFLLAHSLDRLLRFRGERNYITFKHDTG